MSPESSHEEHDALAERRSDQGVWNGFMGEVALTGAYPTNKEKAATSKSHKLVAELDGDAIARQIANDFDAKNPPPPNQNEINARGKALAKANMVKPEKRW